LINYELAFLSAGSLPKSIHKLCYEESPNRAGRIAAKSSTPPT